MVVDRDPACRAARIDDPRVRFLRVDWATGLDALFREAGTADHFVPYHWSPHLLCDWLAREVARAGGTARRGGDVSPHGTPVDRPTRDGDRALSYATWVCPPTCIEPALCPHTRGAKDWSLAGDLEERRRGDPFDGRIVFRCLHLVWGVGTVPMAAILSARDRLLEGLGRGPRSWLVATSSHCHALATVLRVEPPTG